MTFENTLRHSNEFSKPDNHPFSAHRSLKAVLALLAYTLTLLSSFSLVALAQEPVSFEIRVVPESEFAVAGQPFTYTLVITNVSRTPVKEVIVYIETPAGTTFADAGQKANWFTSRLKTGEAGKVGWANAEPVAPDEVITFELTVNVLPEMAAGQLVATEYAIIPFGGDDVIAAGPAVETRVLLTPPTATPVPSPTPTGTPTPTFTATPTPPPTTTGTPTPTSSASATPASQPVTATAGTPAPALPTPSPASATLETNASSSNPVLVMVGLLILLTGAIGLTWFLKRR